MNCQQVQRSLSEYSDGVLKPEKTESVREHLTTCASCRANCQTLQDVLTGLRTLPPVASSADFEVKLQRRLRTIAAERAPRRHAYWWTFQQRLLVPTMVSLVLFIAVGGYLSYYYQQIALTGTQAIESVAADIRPVNAASIVPQFPEAGTIGAGDIRTGEETNYVLYTVSYDNRGATIGF